MSGERMFNGRILIEHAVQEIKAEDHPDAEELGLAVAAVSDLLEVLRTRSLRLEVPVIEGLPDLAAMHAWGLRLVDRARPRRFGFLRR
jgi:hypothetical protein